MKESRYPLQLQTTFSVSTVDDQSYRILHGLDQILNDIREVRKEVDNLERAKALYTIHLKHSIFNYETLKSLYNDIKFKLEYPNNFFSSNSNQLANTYQSNQEFNQQPIIPESQKVLHSPMQYQNASHLGSSNSVNLGGNIQSKPDSQHKSDIKLTEIQWKLVDPSTDQPLLHSTLSISNLITFETKSLISSINYNHTGSSFAFADGHFLYLAQSNNGIIEKVLELPKSSLITEINTRALAYSPDSTFLVASCCSCDISVYSTQTGNLITKLEKHFQAITGLAFLSSNGNLISVGYDGLLCVWDMTNMILIKEISHDKSKGGENNPMKMASKEQAICSVSVGCSDSFVAIGFVNGNVGIYDPEFTQNVLEFQAHSSLLLSVTTSKTEPLILTTSEDRTCKLWSLHGVASLIHTFSGHKDYVITSCFSNDNKLIFTGSKDETIRGWSKDTGKCLFVIRAHNNTIFKIVHNPEREEFVSCSGDGFVCEWAYKKT